MSSQLKYQTLILISLYKTQTPPQTTLTLLTKTSLPKTPQSPYYQTSTTSENPQRQHHTTQLTLQIPVTTIPTLTPTT